MSLLIEECMTTPIPLSVNLGWMALSSRGQSSSSRISIFYLSMARSKSLRGPIPMTIANPYQVFAPRQPVVYWLPDRVSSLWTSHCSHSGPRTNISWFIDGQLLQLGDERITMLKFRGVIHVTIVRVR
jgi:hypothetical protein